MTETKRKPRRGRPAVRKAVAQLLTVTDRCIEAAENARQARDALLRLAEKSEARP